MGRNSGGGGGGGGGGEGGGIPSGQAEGKTVRTFKGKKVVLENAVNSSLSATREQQNFKTRNAQAELANIGIKNPSPKLVETAAQQMAFVENLSKGGIYGINPSQAFKFNFKSPATLTNSLSSYLDRRIGSNYSNYIRQFRS